MKMTIERRIIAISKTREIGENIKTIIKTNIGINCKITMKEIVPIAETDHIVETDHRISMIVIDPMVQMIHIAEMGYMTETNHTIRIGHIAEIDCKNLTIETTIKMIIGMILGMTVERTMKMITEMTIRRTIKMTMEEKIAGVSETRGIKERIESIMKTSVKMGM